MMALSLGDLDQFCESLCETNAVVAEFVAHSLARRIPVPVEEVTR